MRAEVAEVWPRHGLVRLVGRIVGAAPEGRWTLEAVPRRPTTARGWLTLVLAARRPVRVPFEPDGEEFDVAIPVARFAPHRPARRIWWELRMRGPSGQTLPVGRWDDAMPRKDLIVNFPAQRAPRGVRVRPYFTDHDTLTVRGARA